jgi:hypothetical protein
MAHYAFLDENNIVTEVIVGKNEGRTLIGSSTMDRSEVRLASAPHTIPTAVFTLMAAHLTARTTQGLGYTYDANIDAFVPPKPFASWVLNEQTAQWEAPVTMPDDGGMYSWDEDYQHGWRCKMGLNAFTVLGNTAKMTAAATPPTPIQVSSTTLGGNQYRIINLSTSTACFLSYAQTAAAATANCVIPTGDGANAKNCIPILPNTDEILSFVPNGFFTAITASGTADIFITPGDGL